MKVTGFDWDSGNWPKCGKHGVSRAEIEYLFHNRPLVQPDLVHSTDEEERFLAIGKTEEGRHIFIAFTLREKDSGEFIRPVSARYMHDKEVKTYERYT